MRSDEEAPSADRAGLPALDHLEIAVRVAPSPAGGRAFSDVVDLRPGRVGLVQGLARCAPGQEDLLARETLAIARQWLSRAPDDVVLCAREVNRALVGSDVWSPMVQLFLGVHEDVAGALAYVSAAHDLAVIRRRAGALEALEEGGVPLGMMEGFPFGSGRVQLVAGDLLILVADPMVYRIMPAASGARDVGLPGADDVVASTIRALAVTSPRNVIQALLAAVSQLRGGCPVDDIDVIVARAV